MKSYHPILTANILRFAPSEGFKSDGTEMKMAGKRFSVSVRTKIGFLASTVQLNAVKTCTWVIAQVKVKTLKGVLK